MITSRFRISRLVLGALVVLGLVASSSAATFDIPAGPASAALQLFIRQSGKEVIFSFDEMSKITANPVQGKYAPEEALERLLRNTGFTAKQKESNQFVVTRVPKAEPGSIEGAVRDESGLPVPGATVMVLDSDLAARTDRRGRFVLTNVPAGSQTLAISAEGMKKTRVTDVSVRPQHRQNLGTITLPPAGAAVTQLEDYVVSARKEGIVLLDDYLVEAGRAKPFADGNVDMPRTIDDAQPYFILDSRAIDRSAAVDLEGFLKQHLTMNASALSNNQRSGRSDVGNTSNINLRGLGADKTLVLVNGRRMAGVTVHDSDEGRQTQQPDINGIPLAAIDRVEVLTASASGIYGGSAIGGVVNIVLKRDYSGGELRLTYKNTFDTDAPTRSGSLQYGQSLENGRSSFSVSAAWSDAKPLIIADRYSLAQRGVAAILRNNPDHFGSQFFPPLGALTNISSVMGDSLVLRSTGQSLASTYTHLPAGTTPATPAAALASALIANAGRYNLDAPHSYQTPNGLLAEVGGRVKTESYRTTLRREMLPWLELFAEFSYNRNDRRSVATDALGFYVPAGVPFNPFENDVWVVPPADIKGPANGVSTTSTFTVGTLFKLPGAWTGNLDFTRSRNRFHSRLHFTDLAIFSAGSTINVFVDPRAHPLTEIEDYRTEGIFSGRTHLDDVAFRSAGPLSFIPWGDGNLTVGLERRIAETPANERVQDYPIFDFFSKHSLVFPREQVTDSAYAEVLVPLVRERVLPLVHSLELQLAGRTERYEVDAGTESKDTSLMDGSVTYVGPTVNGLPVFTKAKYSSSNGTIGVKYMPTPQLTLRTSMGTAFLPPLPSQLTANPIPEDPFTRLDPVLNLSYPMATVGGGNASLKPQSSESFNAGVIWQPIVGALGGVRANLEYYRIKQRDVVTTLGGSNVLRLESVFPDRVQRDPLTNRVTLIDNSALNLFLRETEGWDFSVDYTLKTGLGAFNFSTTHSYLSDIDIQYSPTRPSVDAAGYSPAEEGAPKYKSTGSLAWQNERWTAGWTTRFVDSYKQYGAAGGPQAVADGAEYRYYIDSQGSDTIGSQVYHDLHLAYAFPAHDGGGSRLRRWSGRLLDGVTVQLVVNNVFDTEPPIDVYYGLTTSYNFYLSPYGDLQMRNYSLSVRKNF